MTRIPIKRVPWATPVLTLFGATPGRTYIQIEPETLTVRFGWYRVIIPREQIASVDVDTWPWFGGYGWRTDFRRRLGLIGAMEPVVKIGLNTSRRARLVLIPIRYTELYVSVDNPDTLRSALSP